MPEEHSTEYFNFKQKRNEPNLAAEKLKSLESAFIKGEELKENIFIILAAGNYLTVRIFYCFQD